MAKLVVPAGLAVLLVLPAGALAGDESEVTIAPKTRLGLELGYGGPLGFAATGELLYGLGADVREDADEVKAVAGLLTQVQAGTGGGKLSLGLAARARIRSDDVKASAGAGLKVSLARTWGSRGDTPDGLTYLGPELDLSAWHVALSLGALFRVGGGHGEGVLFSWGIGVRL
jgi:hypothetical protein